MTANTNGRVAGNGLEHARYYSIRNWDKYQVPARQSGWKPPWCKLYHESLNDYEYTQLSLENRGLLMEMYKLATRTENKIPTDVRWLAHQIHADDENRLRNGLDKLMSTSFLHLSSPVDIEVEVEVEVLRGGSTSSRPSWFRRAS